MTMRGVSNQSRSFKRTTPGPRHVGFGPCFIEKHQPIGIQASLLNFPGGTSLLHVRTILLAGLQDFFLMVNFSAFSALQRVATQNSVPSFCFSSSSVRSGCCSTACCKSSAISFHFGVRLRVVAGPALPCSRSSCLTRRTQDSLQPNSRAIC